MRRRSSIALNKENKRVSLNGKQEEDDGDRTVSAKDLDFLSNYVNSPTVGLNGRATLITKDFDLSSLGNATKQKDPLLPITPPSPQLLTSNGPSLKSCLKQSIKKGRKSVVFGSPNGVEFSSDEPTDSLTPLPKFRLQNVGVPKEEEEEKLDEQSLKNSEYLSQFEEEEEEEVKKQIRKSSNQKRRKSSMFSKQKLAKVQEEDDDDGDEGSGDKTMTALNLNDLLSQNFTSKSLDYNHAQREDDHTVEAFNLQELLSNNDLENEKKERRSPTLGPLELKDLLSMSAASPPAMPLLSLDKQRKDRSPTMDAMNLRELVNFQQELSANESQSPRKAARSPTLDSLSLKDLLQFQESEMREETAEVEKTPRSPTLDALSLKDLVTFQKELKPSSAPKAKRMTIANAIGEVPKQPNELPIFTLPRNIPPAAVSYSTLALQPTKRALQFTTSQLEGLIEKRKQNVNRPEYQTIYVKHAGLVNDQTLYAELKAVSEFDTWFTKVEETRIASFKKSEKKLEEDLREMQTNFGALEALEMQVNRYVAAAGEMEGLRLGIHSLEDQVKETNNSVQALKKQVMEAEKEVEALRQQMQNVDSNVEVLEPLSEIEHKVNLSIEHATILQNLVSWEMSKVRPPAFAEIALKERTVKVQFSEKDGVEWCTFFCESEQSKVVRAEDAALLFQRLIFS